MNEEQRRPYHDATDRIAARASNRIKELQGKADNVERRPALMPNSTPGALKDPIPKGRDEYLRQIETIKRQAKKDIEGVIKQLPPDATREDRDAIRSQAHDILHDRANVTRSKVLTILNEHRPLTQEAIDKVWSTRKDQPSMFTDRQLPAHGKDDPRGGSGAGSGASGSAGSKYLPDPPPDGPAGGGKSATRSAPEHSSPAQASVTQSPAQSKFISQTEQTPKRFSRSDVSIFASPKAEGPDKTRNAEATKDATPKTAERFDRQKESQFTSRVGKTPLNNDRPKVPGLGRDER